MTSQKKVKHLKSNTCRIVKIDKEALFEFVYETMIDRLEEYFDLLDMATVISHHQINHETGEYICVINDEKEQLPDDIDLDLLLSIMKPTTSTIYAPNRYKEMTFDEVRALINKSD